VAQRRSAHRWELILVLMREADALLVLGGLDAALVALAGRLGCSFRGQGGSHDALGAAQGGWGVRCPLFLPLLAKAVDTTASCHVIGHVATRTLAQQARAGNLSHRLCFNSTGALHATRLRRERATQGLA